MRKEYVKPTVIGEMFTANEYFSACWGIACSVPKEMNGNDHMGGEPHNSWGCGNASNQYVQDTGNGAYKLTEFHRWYGKLPCTIYPDGFNYDNKTVNGEGTNVITFTEDEKKNGKTLYWYTKGTDGTEYYHYGNVNISGNSTNHS